MNNLIKINNKELQVKEFNGQRVITFKDIDMLHERVEGTANKRFLDNQKHFVKNADYFEFVGEELKEIKRLPNFGIGLNASKAIFITESGYLMLVKSLTDDLAWKVQRELVNNYFRTKDIYAGMSKELQAILMLDKKYQKQDERISKLENNMTIDYAQQEELSRLAREKIVRVLGGKGTPAYKKLNKKVFSEFWRDYKRIMRVNSYKNTPVKNMDKAILTIDNWKPSEETCYMILGANSQMGF